MYRMPEGSRSVLMEDNPCSGLTNNHIYITLHNRSIDLRRLGNHLFTIASLYGIAAKNGFVPIIYSKHKTLQDTDLSIPVYPKVCFKDFAKLTLKEASSRIYEHSTSNLRAHFANSFLSDSTENHSFAKNWNQNVLIELVGDFQSWQYFEHYSVSSVLKFNSAINTQATQIFQQLLHKLIQNNISRHKYENVVTIGIHIRRGDMLTNKYKLQGYVVPPSEYFYRAFALYENQLFPNKHLYFIVCSDDLDWTMRNIRRKNLDYCPYDGSASLDMAILSLCNHSIISFGTFSWWAGYLAHGTVVYYRDWIRPGSFLSRMVHVEDVYPLHWIPLK